MGIRWACVREEVSCNSSKSHGTRLAGAVCRGRSSEFVGCEEARYARECPARAQQRSVRLRECRMHGCSDVIDADEI